MHPNELASKRATLNRKIDIFSHFIMPLSTAEITDLYLTPRSWHRQVLDGGVWSYSLLSQTWDRKAVSLFKFPSSTKTEQ